MAGITNLPFRILAAGEGAALTFTEMASAASLSRRGKATAALLKNSPPAVPFGVQIFGKNASEMAGAAKIAAEEHGADLVDLNFACPARKVVRSGHGAALLKDPGLLLKITEEVQKSVSVPLTVKTRPGFFPPEGAEEPLIFSLAPRLEALGVSAITVHPRYAASAFGGEADWGILKELSARAKIPIVGSGDVTSAEQALSRLRESGVSFVMLGRAARGRPWLFRECLELMSAGAAAPPTLSERLSFAARHARLLRAEMGARAVFPLRTILGWYLKELPGAASFRARINREGDFERQLEIVREAFLRAEEAGVS
jgi:nifR3 family TIM-barrel protein